MAEVKLLKIGTYGTPDEMDSANDSVTLASFTVTGGGAVLSSSGLDMNDTDISDIADVTFNDGATNTINGIIANDLMSQAKENAMAVGAAVLFPVVTDDADELDGFRLPAIAGTPSATPADGGEGYLVWDSTNDKMYAWTGAAWDDLSSVTSAENIDNTYTADVAISARDAVYISAADSVSPALADASATSYAIGVAVAAAIEDADVVVRKNGILGGFTGLTAGARYFLSAATAGAIAATIPSGTGNVVVQMGYAKSATALDLQILQLGRRA